MDEDQNIKIMELEKALKKLKKEFDDFVLHNHNGLDSNLIKYRTFLIQNGTADPLSKIKGTLAVIDGKLKIYDGSAWTVVGTQT